MALNIPELFPKIKNQYNYGFAKSNLLEIKLQRKSKLIIITNIINACVFIIFINPKIKFWHSGKCWITKLWKVQGKKKHYSEVSWKYLLYLVSTPLYPFFFLKF